MGHIYNAANLGSGYNVTGAGPIDSRMMVKDPGDLWDDKSWGKDHAAYQGMVVSVQNTGDLYILKDESQIKSQAGWKKISGGGSGGSYDGPKIWTGTQAEYDELTPVGDTIYYIQEDGD